MSEVYFFVTFSKRDDDPSKKIIRLDLNDKPNMSLKSKFFSGDLAGAGYLPNEIQREWEGLITEDVNQLMGTPFKMEVSLRVKTNETEPEYIMPSQASEMGACFDKETLLNKISKIFSRILSDQCAKFSGQHGRLIAQEDSGFRTGNTQFSGNKQLDIQLLAEINIFEQSVEPEITILETTQSEEINNMEDTDRNPEPQPTVNECNAPETAPQEIRDEKQKQLLNPEKDIELDIRQPQQDVQTSPLISEKLVIKVRREAIERAKEHAVYEQEAETGGVLLGKFVPNRGKSTTVVVTGIIRGKYTIRRVASLTFTPETWAQVLYWMDNDPIYSDDTEWSMVGWYHTHPSFGIFLSSYDLSIHKNHFRLREHIALVIDPKRNEEGFFSWNKSMDKISKQDFQIVNDDKIREILKLKELPEAEVYEPKRKITARTDNG